MLSVDSVCAFGWWNQKVHMITNFEFQGFSLFINITLLVKVCGSKICLYYPYCLLCLDYQVWSNMLWSLVCDQLKGVDAFDHTRSWLVLFLDLLNSWVRTLLKMGICLHGCHNEWCKILACLLRFGPLFSLAVGSRMISWTSDQFGDRRRLQGISQKVC